MSLGFVLVSVQWSAVQQINKQLHHSLHKCAPILWLGTGTPIYSKCIARLCATNGLWAIYCIYTPDK